MKPLDLFESIRITRRPQPEGDGVDRILVVDVDAAKVLKRHLEHAIGALESHGLSRVEEIMMTDGLWMTLRLERRP